MRHVAIKTALSASILLAAPSANAATYIFTASLSGLQENPPVITTGTGTAIVTVDDVAFTMRVQTTFADLIGTTTLAHIHCCATFPTNAPAATTVPLFPGFPTGVTSGSYDQTFDMMLASSYNPSFVTANGGTTTTAFSALLDGLSNQQAYFNIHSSAFPGGEIRGQLAAVPEPSTWAMMVLGFGIIAGGMRTRQRCRLSAAAA